MNCDSEVYTGAVKYWHKDRWCWEIKLNDTVEGSENSISKNRNNIAYSSSIYDNIIIIMLIIILIIGITIIWIAAMLLISIIELNLTERY